MPSPEGGDAKDDATPLEFWSSLKSPEVKELQEYLSPEYQHHYHLIVTCADGNGDTHDDALRDAHYWILPTHEKLTTINFASTTNTPDTANMPPLLLPVPPLTPPLPALLLLHYLLLP